MAEASASCSAWACGGLFGFAAALIFLQTSAKTRFCSDGVRLSSGFEISFAA
jgi:hypothetical protein